MLKIQDKDGRTKFILSDEDDEPRALDDVILDGTEEELEENKTDDTKGVN